MKPMHWVQGGLGAVLAGVGLVASARVLLPGGGPRSSSVEGWMFIGPALITFGLLLLWTVHHGGRGRENEAGDPKLLLQIGLAFLVVPALVLAWRVTAGGGLAEYAWAVTAFTLGVPGVALAATGLILMVWRSVR